MVVTNVQPRTCETVEKRSRRYHDHTRYCRMVRDWLGHGENRWTDHATTLYFHDSEEKYYEVLRKLRFEYGREQRLKYFWRFIDATTGRVLYLNRLGSNFTKPHRNFVIVTRIGKCRHKL